MTDWIAHPLTSKPTPPKLDPLLVVLTAEVAHSMGLLTQQGPCPTPAYRDPTGRPDAIGASFDAPFATYYNDVPLPGLPLDLPYASLVQLSRLQIASDRWARDASNPRHEAAFLQTIKDLRREITDHA